MTSDESSSNTASSPSPTTIDNEKLQQFMGKVLSDLGGAASAILVYIGDKLGLYKVKLKEQIRKRQEEEETSTLQ